ncbi:glycosyltransferase [Eilatimonas milleporae]|uniref:GT2 family glycosyltransferase n=1 Tax=Eilatimonas milleporae TaxID=911205 RepID=A0A3M0BW59_9PROT|nr:glycosyltransferase [Eilatimonas milleporae]RMB00657.1 GT2 family glycosyltransferase [Eilatimonas milleporae]
MISVAADDALPPAVFCDDRSVPLTLVKSPVEPVLGQNLLWNADFATGPVGWAKGGKGHFYLGLDLDDRYTLSGAHTLFLRQTVGKGTAGTEAAATGHASAVYLGRDDQGRIPLLPGQTVCFQALVGLYRCDAAVELVFFDTDGRRLDSRKRTLTRGEKVGGAAEDDYERVRLDFMPPEGAAACGLRFEIVGEHLRAHEKSGEADLVFFLARPMLFLGRDDVSVSGFRPAFQNMDAYIAAIASGQRFYRPENEGDLSGRIDIRLADDVETHTTVTGPDMHPALNGLILQSNDNLVAYRFKPGKAHVGYHTLRCLIDGRLIGVAHVHSQEDEDWCDVRFLIPDDLMDGMPHGIDVQDRLGRTLARDARVLRLVQTDWFDILKHTQPPLEGKLAPVAQQRYQALEKALARLADSPDPAFEAAELSHCHATLVRGYPYIADFRPLHFPEHDVPRVSVVVPVHNKPAVTYACLAALRLAVCGATCEVIVVDDGSDAETRAMLDCQVGLRIIRHDRAKGFNGATNAGADAAKGDFVVFLNNDTEPAAGWLDELLHPFVTMDDVGITGAKLLYADGRLQDAGGVIRTTGDPYLYGRLRNGGDPRYNYTREVDYVSGAALMIRRSLWREVGGFSRYLAPAYFEDTDLAFKVRKAGKRVLYAPKAVVIHHEGVSHGRDTEEVGSVKRYQEINRPKFKKKWKQALKGQPGKDALVDLVKDRGIEKRVLFIDNEVPRPDYDAGSYAAIQEIRMFQALGYKVTFLPANRAYLGKYTETLQRDGVEVLYNPFAKTVPAVLRDRGMEFDLIFVTRYYVAEHFIGHMRRYAPQAKILFNNADCHFLREMRAAMVQDFGTDRDQALQDARKIREHELAVMRSVDLNFSYNETEIEVLNTHLMGEVPVARLPWVQETVTDAPPFGEREGIMFLGGFGHKPNIEAVHYLAEEVMPRLKEIDPDIVLYVYGSRTTDEIRALEADNIHIMGQIPKVKDAFDRHRIFVAPLLSGAGIKGKVLHAMAHGVPCILSPLAAEGIPGGEHGSYLEIQPDASTWADGIASLYPDLNSLTVMAERSANAIERDYGLNEGVNSLRKALIETRIVD